MNSVNLVGRLTSDPEVRYTADGLAMSKFFLAVDRVLPSERKKELRDEGKKTADFPKIVVWGKQAENLGKYVKKGDNIGICGHLVTGQWIKDDGNKVYTTEVSASEIQFLSSNKFEDSQSKKKEKSKS